MDYDPYAVPFFLLAILVELCYGWLKNKNTYRANDALSSMFMGALRSTSSALKIGLGGAVFFFVETHFSLPRWDPSSILTGSLPLLHMTSFITGFIELVMKDKFSGHLM